MSAAQTRKKIRPGRIELAPDEAAIDVHYETQELVVGADGQERVVSTKQSVKRLRLSQLGPGADVRGLAAELVSANKLIHPSKAGEVERLVQLALERQEAAAVAVAVATTQTPQRLQQSAAPPAGPEAAQPRPFDDSDRQQLRARQQTYIHSTMPTYMPTTSAAPASMDRLEEYIEALYEEDMSIKVAATAAIAQLFRESSNFEELQLHPTLLQTLSRLLRDDYKHSGELCLNLVSVFFSLSHFAQFHPLLVQNQIGSLTMEIVDLELRRCEHWEQREGLSAAEVCSKQMHGETLNSREQRLAGLLSGQEPLLYIATYLLLNMAEDAVVEQKMLKKGLLPCLVSLLARANLELLVLVTTFLRKLSIYAENKQRMGEAGLVARLAALVPGDRDALLASVLRLLHNLAFDDELRLQIVNTGMIPKAVPLLQHAELQPLVLGLLYHLSMEDKYRSMFLYTEAPALVPKLLLSFQGGLHSFPELAALAINLAQNIRMAEDMARSGHVEALLRKGLQEHDPLLWKLLRNMSQHESMGVKVKFAASLPGIVRLLVDSEDEPDLFLEVLGCVANLEIPGFDYLALLTSTQLHLVLARHAQSAATPDDVLLEIVMAMGVLCTDATAGLLVEAGLVESLYLLMLARMEDEEFVLQTTATATALLAQPPSRAALLAHPEVVARFTELLQHPNREVTKAADRALDTISEVSPEWEASIRRLKFEQHNRDWLTVAAVGAVEQDMAALRLSEGSGAGIGGGELGEGMRGGRDEGFMAGMGVFSASAGYAAADAGFNGEAVAVT